jgi:protein TonB
MFEDSLFASGIAPDRSFIARRRRRIALASITLQGLTLAAFLAVPLIWPETLPLVNIAPRATSLLLHKPEPKPQPKPVRLVTTTDSAVHAPSPQRTVESRAPGLISHGPSTASAATSDAPSLYAVNLGGSSTMPFGAGGPIPGTGAPSITTTPAHRTSPFNVSSGVIKGMLIAPIAPTYPTIARSAHVEGTVVLTAIIDKHGRITELHVQSGHPMLLTAALEAVQGAHYRPYLLNGEPTEVSTTISVIFRLGT